MNICITIIYIRTCNTELQNAPERYKQNFPDNSVFYRACLDNEKLCNPTPNVTFSIHFIVPNGCGERDRGVYNDALFLLSKINLKSRSFLLINASSLNNSAENFQVSQERNSSCRLSSSFR